MGHEAKISFIGGDPRQLIAAGRLKSSGYQTALYGFDLSHNTDEKYSPVVDRGCCCDTQVGELYKDYSATLTRAGTLCQTPEQALKGSLAVVLPLPAASDSECISMPMAGKNCSLTLTKLYEIMKRYCVKKLCAGKLGQEFTQRCERGGIEVFDYYRCEEFAVANAIPTAEGAIAIAMNELPITLHSSKALVIGYGRIGKVLSRLLFALGADVKVSARKEEDFAWIRAGGMTAVHTGKLCELLANERFDVIFNTVPHTVLGAKELALIPKTCAIIDLASKPGGVDIAKAKALSLNVIWALSLPGKVAPTTSGYIIADTILGYLGAQEES